MKRRSTACQIILALFLLCLLPLTVWAQETALTTVVPSSHTLSVLVEGEGTILVDGVVYTKTEKVQVQRHRRPEIHIQAAEGSQIKKVLWGEEEITASLRNGSWTAPETVEDAALTVTFEQIFTPQVEEPCYHELWIVLLILALLLLAICLLRRMRKNH